MSNCFDFRHSNVERQMTIVKPTSVPYFRHSYVESQNYTNAERQTDLAFDIRLSNVKLFQRDTNVERQTVLTFDIRMSNVKLF